MSLNQVAITLQQGLNIGYFSNINIEVVLECSSLACQFYTQRKHTTIENESQHAAHFTTPTLERPFYFISTFTTRNKAFISYLISVTMTSHLMKHKITDAVLNRMID